MRQGWPSTELAHSIMCRRLAEFLPSNAQGRVRLQWRCPQRDVIAWSPEASVKLIWRLRENISMTVGYTFLYWSDVALAGDHVNTAIDTPAIFGVAPTSNNPIVRFPYDRLLGTDHRHRVCSPILGIALSSNEQSRCSTGEHRLLFVMRRGTVF